MSQDGCTWQLQERMAAFVRAFGLGEQQRTPCGEPMSPSQAHALAELAEAGTVLSQGELAACLGLERSTVSRLVDQLFERGWCRRERDSGDGRVVRLELTEQGRHAAGRLRRARTARYERLAAQLSDEELTTVLAALESLTLACAAAGRDGGGDLGDGPASVSTRAAAAPRRP